MPKLIKSIFYPIYFYLVRSGRRMGLIYTPSIRFCISTHKKFAQQTLPILINSLLEAGITPGHIYIFEGGYEEKSTKQSSCHHFLADHNSFDLTAMIEVSEMDFETDYWFLLHDTCMVELNFTNLPVTYIITCLRRCPYVITLL